MKTLRLITFCMIAMFIASCSSKNDEAEETDSRIVAFIEGTVNQNRYVMRTGSNMSYYFKSEIQTHTVGGSTRTTVSLTFPLGKSLDGKGLKLSFVNPVIGKNIVKSSIVKFREIDGEIIASSDSDFIDTEVVLNSYTYKSDDISLNISGHFSKDYTLYSGQKFSLSNMNFGFKELMWDFDGF